MKLILVGLATLVYANVTQAGLKTITEVQPISAEQTDQSLIPAGYYKKYSSDSTSSSFNEAGKTRFPRAINPPGERVFVFSPKLRAWAAYSPDGNRIGYGRANGGADWCSELGAPCRTPEGIFRVRSKGVYECKSRKFPLPNGGAPMPYCMYFSGGYAIHGSPYISNNNSSHGCIRVQTKAAHWLSNNFLNIGTRVVVVSYE